MVDKYNMSLEENIFLAKRNIIDSIWKSARLEGIAVTFPDTEAIYNGLNVPSMKVDDIVAINNLKHAWQFMLDTIDYPFDYAYLCKLHQCVGSNLIYGAGRIRTVPVSIGGTSWKPDFPIESVIKEEIAHVLKTANATERAIEMALYAMRKQIFLDGNKRVSMLAANQIMISNGVGILSVPVEKQAEFTHLLINYYETNKNDEVKEFLYESCIDGLAFEHEKDYTVRVKKEITDAHFKPTSTLVENMQHLREVMGRTIPLKELAVLYKNRQFMEGTAQKYVEEIGNELMQQELGKEFIYAEAEP